MTAVFGYDTNGKLRGPRDLHIPRWLINDIKLFKLYCPEPFREMPGAPNPHDTLTGHLIFHAEDFSKQVARLIGRFLKASCTKRWRNDNRGNFLRTEGFSTIESRQGYKYIIENGLHAAPHNLARPSHKYPGTNLVKPFLVISFHTLWMFI